MTAMTMSQPRVKILRSLVRWLAPAALFALTPKCFVCLAAYIGFGTALGVKLGGQEVCGASTSALTGSSALLCATGFALGLIQLRRLAQRAFRRRTVGRAEGSSLA